LAVAEPVSLTLYEKACKFKVLRDLKEQLESQLKETNKNLDQAETELSDLMIAQEISKFPHNGATFYLSTKLHANSIAARRTDLRIWLIMSGQGQILLDTVDDKKLTSYVKGLLDESDELPPELSECITVFEKPSVCIRKQNSKEDKSDGN
jgi:hypothetical protein